MTPSERDPGSFLQWEDEDGRNDPAQRFACYRLCVCEACGATGKTPAFEHEPATRGRCRDCNGEGRTLELVATAGTPEAAGVAIVTLAREREFEECPFGLLDRQGETGQKWLIRPWLPSPRNVSDAGKLLRSQRG